jgi:prepilin signal peptidase PulO-like enzyme (type II secretory pathway)
MPLVAQGSLILGAALLLLAATCLLAVLSLILSFTKARRDLGVLACAVPALLLGLLLSVANGRPDHGAIYLAFYLGWANFLIGLIATVRWFVNRIE